MKLSKNKTIDQIVRQLIESSNKSQNHINSTQLFLT